MSLALGSNKRLRGTITRLKDVFAYEPSVLEDRIGYGRGRLSRGYYLVLLTEPFGPDDFEFMGHTYFSGGKLGLPSNDKSIEAARHSVVGQMLTQYGQPGVEEIKKQFCKHIPLKGPERFAKVIPIIPHDDEIGAADQYPRGLAGCGKTSITNWRSIY